MSGYLHPHTLLDLGKAQMREYHREWDGLRLAQEARNCQPGPIRNALNQVVSHCKRFGRALREESIADRAEIGDEYVTR